MLVVREMNLCGVQERGGTDLTREPEYITIAEARELLGVSKPKIADLIKKGILPATEDPLDRRFKRVLKSDVERLAGESSKRGKSAA